MRSLVVANWKMHPQTFAQAKALFTATKKAVEAAPSVELIVAPPSLYLHELAASYRGKKIQFAAQNAHFDKSGAYTGEISLPQVHDAGARSVLIGHAERRAFGETNDDTRKKVTEALALKLTPILCVGEAQRNQQGEHFAFVKEQLRAGFSEVAPSALSRVVVAYEPVWAIGAVNAMEPRQMHEMAIFIRKSIVEAYGEKGHSVKILYGGAVDAENAGTMLTEGDVVGLLVGRVSTDALAFKNLLTTIQKI
jgi:triosephosphate isomerase